MAYNGGAASGGASYSYDGDGRRIKKVAGAATTVFVYDVVGRLVAEYDSNSQGAGGTSYLTADSLGTPRVVTDGSGNVVSRHDYLPFGEEAAGDPRTGASGYGAADGVRQKFTGYERDNESGLDYAKKRYYSNLLGRFTSSDAIMEDSQLIDPQSWNKYAYVRNNPLRYVDPTGGKAEIDIKLDQNGKTGTVTVRASFGVYLNHGEISRKLLNQQKAEIKKQIESGWGGTYKHGGVTFTVQVIVSKVNIYDNETQAYQAAKAGKIDNLVAIEGSNTAEYNTGLVIGQVGARTGRYSGEDFDRMLIARGSIDPQSAYHLSDAYTHEFTHLLGNSDLSVQGILTNTDPSQRAHSATQQDFEMTFGKHIDANESHFTLRAPIQPRGTLN